jgi:hypothetical protein
MLKTLSLVVAGFLASLLSGPEARAATVSGAFQPGQVLMLPSFTPGSSFNPFFVSLLLEYEGPAPMTQAAAMVRLVDVGGSVDMSVQTVPDGGDPLGLANAQFATSSPLAGPFTFTITANANFTLSSALFYGFGGGGLETVFTFDNSTVAVPLPWAGALLPVGLMVLRRRRRA